MDGNGQPWTGGEELEVRPVTPPGWLRTTLSKVDALCPPSVEREHRIDPILLPVIA
jgi:hypothetical protein